jgi:23S rRNA pseudouridine2605 synthase
MSKNFKKKGPFSSDEKKKGKGSFSFPEKTEDKKKSRSSERDSKNSDKRSDRSYKKKYTEAKPEHPGSFRDKKDRDSGKPDPAGASRDKKNFDKPEFKRGRRDNSGKTDYKKPFSTKYAGKKESGSKVEVAGKGRLTGYRKKDIYEKAAKSKNSFTERREKRPDERGDKSFKHDEKPAFKRNDSGVNSTERPFKKKQSSYSNWREKGDKPDKPEYKKPADTRKREEIKDGDKPLFKKTFGDKGISKGVGSDREYKPKKFAEHPEAKNDRLFRKSGADKENLKSGKSFGGKPAKKLPFAASREKSDNVPSYNLKRPMKAKKETKEKVSDPDGLMRLNKYISNAGLCSRRDADKMIEEGLIKVNGKVITELGYKIKPTDIVQHSNNTLKKERPVYVLLNKPKDFITTTDDPGERKTVMDLVANACKERIYPVGRLDRNTSGLLLLTNDGELAAKLTHPSNEIKKVYQADLDKPLEKEDFEKILNGLELEDGPVKVDDLAIVSPDRTCIGLEIHEGRNRIVRRLFEHLGYDVVKLDRVVYAGLTKKDLPRGNWRHLSEKEVVQLKFFI